MITQAQLKTLLTYDPGTGLFTWNYRGEDWFKPSRTGSQYKTWNNKFNGKLAGVTINSKGKSYSIIQFRVSSKGAPIRLRAHRLAWLYTYGGWPKEEIDHIDGNGLNNAILNLRDVSRTENMRNMRKISTNTSGHTGVHIEKSTGKFEAHISKNNKKVSLGRFSNIEDAIKARSRAEVAMGYHKNHGADRPL